MEQNQKDVCDSLIGVSCRARLLRFHQFGPERHSWRAVFDIEHGRVRTGLHQLRQNDPSDKVWKGATSEQGGIRFWPAEIGQVLRSPSTSSTSSTDEEEDGGRGGKLVDEGLSVGKSYDLTLVGWNLTRGHIFKYDTGIAWTVIAALACPPAKKRLSE